jgi:hypothetical protein
METVVLVILGAILVLLLVLNHVTVIETTNVVVQKCAQTTFGCCPDGVTSKVNYYGTNCPGFVPQPAPAPSPPKPIGGCAGTRYGCCPDGTTSRADVFGTNCPH